MTLEAPAIDPRRMLVCMLSVQIPILMAPHVMVPVLPWPLKTENAAASASPESMPVLPLPNDDEQASMKSCGHDIALLNRNPDHPSLFSEVCSEDVTSFRSVKPLHPLPVLSVLSSM